MTPFRNHALPLRVASATLVLLLGPAMLAACGSDSTSSTAGQTSSAAGGQVLPVTSNPISNDATAKTLTIDSVLVENNEDPASKKAVDDHLEVELTNTGTTELDGFEVYSTFTDPTDKVSESYYTKLPDSFTIAPGATRTVHFDNTGATDHFPSNDFGILATSKNGLDVEVMVSATGAAVQTQSVKKDPGGAENPAE